MDGNSQVRVETVHCPHGCGWYRSYRKQEEWLRRIVDHPQYGPVTEMELVQFDIRNHDCREYLNAQIRLRRIRRNREQSAA